MRIKRQPLLGYSHQTWILSIIATCIYIYMSQVPSAFLLGRGPSLWAWVVRPPPPCGLRLGSPCGFGWHHASFVDSRRRGIDANLEASSAAASYGYVAGAASAAADLIGVSYYTMLH